MGVFSKSNNPKTDLKRNVFDLSFQNNLTLDFGGLYPVFCKEALPGDTFKIKTSFGLNFMPTVFPIQNRIRADIHFFYVRSRNLWDEWKKFITNSGTEKSIPYLNVHQKSAIGTGTIYDYMGLPTHFFDSVKESLVPHLVPSVNLESPNTDLDVKYFTLLGSYNHDYLDTFSLSDFIDTPPLTIYRGATSNEITIPPFSGYVPLLGTPSSLSGATFTPASSSVVYYGRPLITNYVPAYNTGLTINVSSSLKSDLYAGTPLSDSESNNCVFRVLVCERASSNDGYVKVSNSFVSRGYRAPGAFTVELPPSVYTFKAQTAYDIYLIGHMANNPSEKIPLANPSSGSFLSPVTFSHLNPLGIDSSDSNAWNLTQIQIQSLPFRAYEQVYNSFYRDERNNPLIINGKPSYDQYLTSLSGGEETNEFSLRYRNWEQDFLTSALPSPQQGEPPLVGISAIGEMTFRDPETQRDYTVMAKTADDSDTIIGAEFSDKSLPKSVYRSLVNYATSGISINDFRNVNALQRYLETNLRRGLKYKDQLESRFGVNVSYAELDMPEFIGGVTQDVTPSRINQTSDGGNDSPLGSYAGQLTAFGTAKHDINHYCDEHGYIIGILSVVPVPVYSQILPKIFTKSDVLDFFNPEFGHIGMQPIPYREVSPLQVTLSTSINQMDTFGYQRAWYDYLASVDETHGQFRTTLNNFLMYRTFSDIPTLSPDFLTIHPDQVNDVFSVQDSSDKIMGSVYFDCNVRRPIPRYGTPRLE